MNGHCPARTFRESCSTHATLASATPKSVIAGLLSVDFLIWGFVAVQAIGLA